MGQTLTDLKSYPTFALIEELRSRGHDIPYKGVATRISEAAQRYMAQEHRIPKVCVLGTKMMNELQTHVPTSFRVIDPMRDFPSRLTRFSTPYGALSLALDEQNENTVEVYG